MIAGKAVGFGEALQPEFKEYQKQVLKNAEYLANVLMSNGVKLLTNGTNTHLMLLDLRDTGITGAQLEKALENVGITTNKNAIPFDTVSPKIASGLRIGTPSVTTRGMKETEMEIIGNCIVKIINELKQNSEISITTQNSVYQEVHNLTEKFPLKLH